MQLKNNAPNHSGTLLATVPKSLLQGLSQIATHQNTAEPFKRIHIDSRQGLLVAMNPHMMLWVQVRFRASTRAFTLSSALCAQALQAAAAASAGIDLCITAQDTRRRTYLYVGEQEFSEEENLASYPDPRAIFAPRPDAKAVDFDPDLLAELRSAVSLIVARKREPLHVISRGSAPALVVCRSPHVLGFIMPWEATDDGEHWRRTTLHEFGVDLSQCQPPARRPVAALPEAPGLGRLLTVPAPDGEPLAPPPSTDVSEHAQ